VQKKIFLLQKNKKNRAKKDISFAKKAMPLSINDLKKIFIITILLI